LFARGDADMGVAQRDRRAESLDGPDRVGPEPDERLPLPGPHAHGAGGADLEAADILIKPQTDISIKRFDNPLPIVRPISILTRLRCQVSPHGYVRSASTIWCAPGVSRPERPE
jgi:hypothetical protein